MENNRKVPYVGNAPPSPTIAIARQPLAERTTSEVNSANNSTARIDAVHSVSSDKTSKKSSTTPQTRTQGLDLGLIDPQLLDASQSHITSFEDNEALDVSADDLDNLERTLFNTESSTEMGETEMGETEIDDGDGFVGMALLVDQLLQPKPTQEILLLPGPQFIVALARINTVHNTSLIGSIQTLDQKFPLHVSIGNSRDPPSLFTLKCPHHINGCGFTAVSKDRINRHLPACLEKFNTGKPFVREEAKPFRCVRDGCDRAYSDKKSLSNHVADYHDWDPKACDMGCEEDVPTVFESAKAYRHHVKTHHTDDDWVATSCQVPECPSERQFEKRTGYDNHLTNCHKLRGIEKHKYLPARNGPKENSFRHQSCPLGGFSACDTVYKIREQMVKHLMVKKGHNLEREEAEDIAG